MNLQTTRRSLGMLLAVLSTVLFERFLDLGPRTVLALGTFGKLLFLIVATVVAAANVGKFEPGTPTRTAWRLLSLGFRPRSLLPLAAAPAVMGLDRGLAPLRKATALRARLVWRRTGDPAGPPAV